MRHRLGLLSSAFLLAPLAFGCSSYEFRAQDVLVRHDEASDALELIVVSHGLLRASETSACTAGSAAQGARHGILLGWPFEFDLDETEAMLRASESPLAERRLAFIERIAVEEAAAWLDGAGETVLYQRVLLPRASEGLALLNAVIHAENVRQATHEDVAGDLGPETGALWGAFVQEERSWASFEDGALVVRLPVSPEGAARVLEDVIAHDEDGWQEMLVRPLSAVSVEGGLVTLTWRPDATGWIRFRAELGATELEPLALPSDVELLPGPPEAVAALLARDR